MKFLGIAFCLTLALAVVAFTAIGMINVPVEQTSVSKTIPNERFYNGGAQR